MPIFVIFANFIQPMKPFYTAILFFLVLSTTAYGQIYEVGLFLGGSNLISDVGSTRYVNPNQIAVGGVLKWNRSARHAYRASLIYSPIEAVDANADDPRRRQRNLKYSNNSFIEFSAGMEFTFFDFDLHTYQRQGTPYLYSGISLAYHDNYYFDSGSQISEDTGSFAYGIPMVVGYKHAIADHLILAVEIGARYTFSDELDGSVPDKASLISTYSFGNVNNNDWYMFTGITLTYTFGRDPCYCGVE